MYNKTIISFGFCDIQNNRGLGKGYQPQPSASASINLDYSGYHKNLMIPIIVYKFTVVYCESLNLIGYITVFYLLIENSYASVHIAYHV